ncbi:hypothetical protein [Paenibacillus tianmuensis]|uniref:hypothetical protein n=1 Tax=Paenibacillus tianmuensis TaxID=624147 RepID=UPI000B827970|nr:hypothetical protein [Paenibacillus tianmuensis]
MCPNEPIVAGGDIKIYTAPNRKIINSLVGYLDKLFWVEYERKRDEKGDLPWQLKCMDLRTQKITTVRKGVGQDQILPPILRIHKDKLTWIEKEIVKGVVLSHLYVAIADSPPLKIYSASLNEVNKEQRSGVFLDIQRPRNGKRGGYITIFLYLRRIGCLFSR